MKSKVELHIVIDKDGIRSVQIMGPTEVHQEGHDLYFKIRHLIPQLDQEIQRLLKDNERAGDKGAR
jgi:hypothetical protein